MGQVLQLDTDTCDPRQHIARYTVQRLRLGLKSYTLKHTATVHKAPTAEVDVLHLHFRNAGEQKAWDCVSAFLALVLTNTRLHCSS